VQGLMQAAVIGVMLGVQYALLALGFTLIFGILGVINFAHGGFYMLGGYLAYSAVTLLGVPFPIAVLLAVLGSALVGFLYEVVFIERFVTDEHSTMMLTMGLYLVLTSGMLAIYGPQSPQFTFPITGTVHFGAIYVPLENLVVLSICVVGIASLYAIMYRTGFGRALRALADDRPVATAQGMRVRILFPLAFAMACGLAGLTGAVVTPILVLSPNVGEQVLVTAFLTVVFGGLGSLGGATIAAFIVGFVEAYSTIYLGSSTGALALFVIVLIILTVRPPGLLGHEIPGA
jgi:branched-chain amino acid transport system permease protein